MKVTVAPANATDAGFEAYALDARIGIGNVDSAGFEVSADADAEPGAYEVLVVATGGDPAQKRPTATCTVTVTAKA